MCQPTVVRPVTVSLSRGLDAAAVMYGDDETLWVERCTRLNLPVKKKSYHQNPLSHPALFAFDQTSGARCFPQLSTLFDPPTPRGSSAVCVLGPNSCQ